MERRRLRLGTPSPACEACGETDVVLLYRVNSVAGNVKSLSTILCASCKRKHAPLGSAAKKRKAQAIAKAGYDIPACGLCGESALVALELHHLAGAANSESTIALCANCHARQSDAQEDTPIDFRRSDPNRGPLERQAAWLIGAALVLIALIIFLSDEGPTGIARAITLGIIASGLFGWGVWNVAADAHLMLRYGPQYAEGVLARLPQ